ncbi:MAG: TonB-dependent receptor [Rhodothermales bacterium]
MRVGLPFVFAVLLTFAFPADGWAQSAAVRGFVTDSEDGVALPGATVVLDPLGTEERPSFGTATDGDGLYVLARFPSGRYRLRVSFVGYESHVDTLAFASGEIRFVDVALRPSDALLGELVVEGERAEDTDLKAGLRSIDAADIERVPTPGVAGDLAAYLTTVPGVVATGESGGQLFIRGGEPSQNLVLLDGIPLYQPFHVLGFYSAFPAEIVSRADLYAGGFGGRFGGHLSSVLDVSSRNGSLRRPAASASAAPFVSGLRAEFPILRDRVSVLASGRLSVIEDAGSKLAGEDLPYRFGDVFGKLHVRLVENSQLSFTALHTFDRGMIREAAPGEPAPPQIRWSNLGLGGRYLFLPGSSPLRGEIVVALTRFDTETGPPGQRFPDQQSRVEKWSSRMEVTQYGRSTEIRGGLFAGTTTLESDLDIAGLGERETLTDVGLYVEPEIRLRTELTVTPGLRIHAFPSLGDTFVEPRLRALWRRGVHQISAAAGLYHQEIVGISDRRDAAGVFTAWAPAPTGEVAGAVHALVGYRVTPTTSLTLSAEGYLKWLSDLSVAEWTAFPRFTTNLQPAEGRARGVELSAEYRRGALFATLGYSLSSVRYTAMQEQLPLWYGTSALDYRPTHDRRHQINALVGTTVAGFDLSARWQFGSGLPFSRALGFDRFLLLDGGVDVFEVPATDRVIYERPFNAVLPAYHRLDLSVERTFDVGAAELTLQAGLVNAYDRANLFYYDAFTLRRVDQLPLLPSFGLQLAFD